MSAMQLTNYFTDFHDAFVNHFVTVKFVCRFCLVRVNFSIIVHHADSFEVAFDKAHWSFVKFVWKRSSLVHPLQIS